MKRVNNFNVCSQNFLWEPFPKRQILNSSKLKQSADNNFQFDKNSRKFPKRVENTVGKEEIAHYEQFLLYPKCFQKACFQEASKGVIVWEWGEELPYNFLLRSNLVAYC